MTRAHHRSHIHCCLLAFMAGVCLLTSNVSIQAGEFCAENFESYGLNSHWVSPEFPNRAWNQWPGDATPCATIIQPGRNGGKAVVIHNTGSVDYYLRTGKATQTPAWGRASQESTLYFRFYFMVPREMEGHPGYYLNFSVDQMQGSNTAIAPYLLIINEKKSGRKVMACNGPGDGTVQWQKVAEWDFDEWTRVDVTMHMDTRKYDVSVNGRSEEKDLNFRMAQDWKGDNLGPRSQVRFSVPPGGKIQLDDIAFDTEPLQP